MKTDHKKLTYINNDFNGRVERWKLAIQDYTFDVEHVPDKDNIVTDGLSRFVPQYVKHENQDTALALREPMPIPDDKYIFIARCHKSTLAGHGGVQCTINKLDTLGHQWCHRREHVK